MKLHIVLCLFLLSIRQGVGLVTPFSVPKIEGLYAQIETDKGNILCRLEPHKAPLTVANFVALVEGKHTYSEAIKGKRFYDGLSFHRFVPGFVVQAGDPDANGTGGPGFRLQDEFNTALRHKSEGVLSMANSGPATNGSQFFITLAATPHLDFKYSVFGKVVEGLDVLREIRQGTQIKTIQIHRVGKQFEQYNPLQINVSLDLNSFLLPI